MNKLVAHIKAENANRENFTIVEDLAHWASKDIYTVEQYEQYMMDATYSDLHKEVYGMRPRGCYPVTKEAYDSLVKQHEEYLCAEAALQDESIKSFEAVVTKTMMAGNVNRDTAIQWLKDAEGDDYFDDGMFCFTYNLPYNYFDKKLTHLV